MKLYCPYGCGAIAQGQRCVCGARPVRYVPKMFRCCMDCGPDVIDTCRKVGCQVDILVAKEKKYENAA